MAENDHCEKCKDGEQDVIVHCLWECCEIQNFLRIVLQDGVDWTGRDTPISMHEYLFGIEGNSWVGLNQYLLEAKMFIFYSWKPDEHIDISLKRFHCQVRRVIKTEKFIMSSQNKDRDRFTDKWEHFGNIYQIFGPDEQEVW